MSLDSYWIRRSLAVMMVLAALLAVPAPASARLVDALWEGKVSRPPTLFMERQGEVRTVIVRKGDTLSSLSHRYGVDMEVVAAMNGMITSSPLLAGQVLRLPAEQERLYRVQAGDTIWQLARLFRVDANRIIAANDLQNPDRLKVGQLLAIPGGNTRELADLRRQGLLASRQAARGAMDWPVLGVVSSPFGPRSSGFHHGVDIAARTGTAILAAAAGEVVFSGWKNGIYGRVVVINHGDGLATLYAHNSVNLVAEGDRVEQGQIIARVGNTGKTTGPHVHFEVLRDQLPIDPMTFLVQ